MELATSIRNAMIYLGHKWSFRDRNGTGPAVDTPTVHEVDSFIQTAVGHLGDRPGGWFESGRILIKNDYGTRDVYVHVGTIEIEENNND